MENTTSQTTDELLPQKVTIKSTRGNIVFQFYANFAPLTRARLTNLINEGFYNGLTFHRVVPGFVIQGGDPRGDGTGGSGVNLKAEFNQVLKHQAGTLAMARANDPDSADSQFYIALGDFPHLDGNYTIFGKVVEGLEVAYKIQEGDVMLNVSF